MAKSEERRVYERLWREENKEAHREKKRAWVLANREHVNAYSRRYIQAHPEKRRAYKLRCEFGISPDQYDELLAAQGGVCAICRRCCSTGQNLSVDHDHVSGEVRGLLCRICNASLGAFRDDPEIIGRALEYVVSWRERSS